MAKSEEELKSTASIESEIWEVLSQRSLTQGQGVIWDCGLI